MHGSLSLALHAVHLAGDLHHRFAGPHIDYVGVGLAAAVSWVGITGPGEAALIAAAIAAAHGHVDVTGMIFVAWLGAMAGGVAGWMIGLKGGRALMIRPGPLYRARLRLVRHGDEVYARRGWLAVYLAPSWMAGISRMRAERFLPANAVASLLWALAIGLGAYLSGPSVAEALGDLGTIGLVVLVALVAVSALLRSRLRGR